MMMWAYLQYTLCIKALRDVSGIQSGSSVVALSSWKEVRSLFGGDMFLGWYPFLLAVCFYLMNGLTPWEDGRLLLPSCDLEDEQVNLSSAGGLKYGTGSLISQSSNSLYFTDFTIKITKCMAEKSKIYYGPSFLGSWKLEPKPFSLCYVQEMLRMELGLASSVPGRTRVVSRTWLIGVSTNGFY